MSGTPAGIVTWAASLIAVICGTPTPAMMRVVQMEPGPTPTFTASAPASTIACAPARVAAWPPITSTCAAADSFLSRAIISSTPWEWPLAVSMNSASTPASTRVIARSQPSPKKPTAAPTRSRPSSSLVARGYCSALVKSLTVMSPVSRSCSSTRGSFSILCWASSAWASSLPMPTLPVTSGMGVITSRTRRVSKSLSGR